MDSDKMVDNIDTDKVKKELKKVLESGQFYEKFFKKITTEVILSIANRWLSQGIFSNSIGQAMFNKKKYNIVVALDEVKENEK